MRKALSFLVGSFVVLVLFVILGSLLLPAPMPRAYEDPVMTAIKSCAQNQERIQHPVDESGKAEIMWWCMRRQSRTN